MDPPPAGREVVLGRELQLGLAAEDRNDALHRAFAVGARPHEHRALVVVEGAAEDLAGARAAAVDEQRRGDLHQARRRGLGLLELGVAGAAIATVIGRFVTFSVALYVLIKREKVLVIQRRKLREMIGTWKEILAISIPAGLSRVILPIGSGIITGMVAVYGVEAVAGFGMSTRIENFMIIIANAMASIIIPFAGQNIGARKFNRIKTLFKNSNIFVLVLQAGLYVAVLFAAEFLTGLFSDDPEVIRIGSLYLRIVAAAYGFKGIILICSAFLNVLKRPFIAAALNLMQMFVIFIPLAWLGGKLAGLPGVFTALAISLLLTATAAWIFTRNRISSLAGIKTPEVSNEGTDKGHN